MSTAVTKTRPAVQQPPTRAAQTFWKSLQQFASAADSVVRAPRAALVEGGIKSRKRETNASQLAAELRELSEKIDEIRERLAASGGRLVSPAERAKAEQLMSKLVHDGALVTPAAFVERLKITRQALSKALAAQRVFYVEVAGQRHYPEFFLDSCYERRQLELVSKALGELPGASKLQFFMTSKASLEGKTPLEALARGQFSRVRTAAQGFAER
jgi:dTDP-4-amino-4,6-dideoxygalactose transaminase